MGDTSASPQASNGLNTVINTIASPNEAFATLSEAPTWGWAFIIAAVLGAVGTYLMIPAIEHAQIAAFNAQAASNPRMAQLTPEQLARARGIGTFFVHMAPFLIIVMLPIIALFQTVIMLVFNAIGKGSGTFKSFFSAAMNIAVIGTGIFAIAGAAIALLRGPAAFADPTAASSIIPSLGMLFPHGTKIANFFNIFNVIYIWAAVLFGLAMLRIGRVGNAPAWLTAAVIILIPALFALATPTYNH